MGFRIRLLAASVVVAGLLALPVTVSAHALLVSSDPAAGTSVATAPASITLTFSESPDLGLTRIRVLDATGTERRVEAPQPVPGVANAVRVGLEPLDRGVYTVVWRTVSAADGHASAGSFAFGVGAGTVATKGPPAQGGETAATSLGLTTLARWLLYVGLAMMLGVGLVGTILHPAPPPRLATLARSGWLVSALGVAGVVALQWLDSGADARGFWLSSLAIPAAARAAAAVVAGAAARLVPWSRRTGYGVVFIAAAACVLVDVLAGHAAAAAQPPVAIAVQFVHGVTAGAWIGGLAALLVAIRGQSTDDKIATVRRYSTIAGVLLALVGLTGLLRAIDQVGTVQALVGTDFGRVAVAKSVGLFALAGIGALNRFVNVPAIATSFRGLRRAGTVEVAAGIVVFALSGLLVNVAPPLKVTSASLPPVVANGADFGTTVRLRLTVTPGTPGFNTFSAAVKDFDSGAAVPATALSLRFALVSQTGVGTSTLDLHSDAPGSFSGDGGNLSIDGIWQATAVVAAPGGAIEVPLVLATRVPAQPVTSDPSIQPVIYSIALPGRGSAQTYLDPGSAGSSELHITYFDAAGKELPVPATTMSLAQGDAPGVIVNERQLEPGHFVATVSLAEGPVTVDATGPDPNGGQVHVVVTMQVAP
jgi:copper transport protein